MNDSDPDLNYLRDCLELAPFKPYPWNEEDRNLYAFTSKEALIEWYCQPPGIVNQPYRDRAFYTRELAMLSRLVKPSKIVEFGTSLGIGTCLLRWLNPGAQLITVDVKLDTFLPGDKLVEIGHLAKHQEIRAVYVNWSSRSYYSSDVGLCFIDAEHTYPAVTNDSERAWENKVTDGQWAIVWHDYNDRHPGVMEAVLEFCASKGVQLQSRPDSDTVWIMGGE